MQKLKVSKSGGLKTREIGLYNIGLKEGHRYVASRPFANGWRKDFTVTISEIAPSGCHYPIHTIPGLSYDAANCFLADFNDGAYGFEGRVW